MRLGAYEAFCAQRGEDPAHVGLAWLLHQPAVTAPIIGPRTAGQLDGALAALEITLDDRAPRSTAAVPVTSRCPSRA